MFARPEIPLWEGASSYYALGWHVRPGMRENTIWHTGSLPGTNAILYRTSDGLIWAALFNSHPDTSENAFFVDLITQMGKAAFLDELLWGGLLCLSVFAMAVVIFIGRRRKKRNR